MFFSELRLKYANDIYSTISSGSGTSILLFQGDAGLKGPVGAQGDMGNKVYAYNNNNKINNINNNNNNKPTKRLSRSHAYYVEKETKRLLVLHVNVRPSLRHSIRRGGMTKLRRLYNILATLSMWNGNATATVNKPVEPNDY
jgi:hypothetical protein